MFYSKDKALPKLDEIVESLGQSVESRKQQKESELSMSIDLIKFVRKEAPPFEKSISFAIAPMHKISKIEEQELLSEKRLKEDLNDILERRKVVLRIENEYKNALEQLEQSKIEYQDAKMQLQYEYDQGTKGKQLELVENYYAEAKSNRIKCFEAAKEATRKLIDAKNKFSKFLVNRTKHGFEQYGKEIGSCASEKAELYSQMSQSFSELRRNIDDLSSGNAGSLQPTEVDNESSEEKQNEEKPKTDVFQTIKNPFDDL